MRTQKQLFEESINKWGIDTQILMLAEEASELSVASLHLLRKKKVLIAMTDFVEEVADVELMTKELKWHFQIQSRVSFARKRKERRLNKYLDEVEPKSEADLTSTEASDVAVSREEIRQGKAKKFANADALLKELKEGE